MLNYKGEEIVEEIINFISTIDSNAKEYPEKHYDHIFRSHVKQLLDGYITPTAMMVKPDYMNFHKVIKIENNKSIYSIHIKTLYINVVEKLIPQLIINNIQIQDVLETELALIPPRVISINSLGLLTFQMGMHRESYKHNLFENKLSQIENYL